MKYQYLVINEDINTGLLKSQVISPLSACAEFGLDVELINIHKLGRGTGEYRNKKNIPIAIPYRAYMFNFLFFLTPIIAFLYSLILFFYIKRGNVVAARSYFPSLVLYFLSKYRNVNYIFDSRSLFIDENTLNGNFKVGSLNYKMWKFFEKLIVDSSVKTIAVSKKQLDYYKNISPGSCVEIIPCYARVDCYSSTNSSDVLKEKMGYLNDDIIIAYYGSLDNGWNNIDLYNDFFNVATNLGAKVIILSQSYNYIVNDPRLQMANVTIVDTRALSSVEVNEILKISDYGVVLMKKAADWETRLSVKFVDYLSAGLQVIVGQYVGEACRYARESFSDRAIIYGSDDQVLKFSPKENYSNDKVSSIFGEKNMLKVFS